MASRSQFTLAFLFTVCSISLPAALITQRGVAFNPGNGKVYAVDQPADSILVIDSTTNRSTGVRVGAAPDAIAVNLTTGIVYVANSAGGTVSVLDPTSNKVTATIKAGPHPYNLALNEVTNRVYVTNTFSDLVAVIDGSTNSSRFLKIGSADNLLVDSERNLIYLIGYEDANIRILDGASETVQKQPASEHLWGMALNASSGKLYATGAGSGDMMGIHVGSIPCCAAINEKTNKLYVVNYGDDTVTVIDATSETTIATVNVGSGPQALSVDTAANLIYVANTHADSVSVIDGRTNVLVKTVAAGRNPFGITHSNQPGVAYVANLSGPPFTRIQAQ